MAVNGYDVQVFLCKILKLLSITFITLLVKYPFPSFSLLSLFLLYVTFPWFFWYLIYSFPLFVFAGLIILRTTSSLGNGKIHKNEENDEKFSRKSKSAGENNAPDNSEKSFTRVHSVRKRRAKNIARLDDVVEKNAVSTINIEYGDIVDKNAVIEENPKEIREVQVLDSSLVNDKVKVKDEEEKQSETTHDANNASEEEDEKNVMEDIGILEIERNKRLESLIARRRSRKLLNLQVRRTLMKMDRNNRISNLVIPKLHANSVINHANNMSGGPLSPVPGSAPSILIPMHNPFDIPYDPHEEKPDLTGDSFSQEFNISSSLQNKDMMFCRHESFHFGPFSPDSEDQDTEKTYDFRFGQNGSSRGYHHSDRESSEIIKPQPCQVPAPHENGSIIDNPHDQIKEIIQISENGIHNHAQDNIDQDKSTQEGSSSSSSSQEDQQFLKIDKEAILKSLSSLARRNVLETNDDQINNYLSYPTSLFRNRDEQFYYGDKTVQRHAPSYSIASDMHVELSEVSSPPLTIDESMSFQGDDISTYDGDMESNAVDMSDLKILQDNYEANIRSSKDCEEERLENIPENDKMVTLSTPVERSEHREHFGRPPEVSLSLTNSLTNGFDCPPTKVSISRTTLVSDGSMAEESIPQTTLGPQTARDCDNPPCEETITRTISGSNSPTEVSISQTVLSSNSPPVEVIIPQNYPGSDSPLAEVSIPQTSVRSNNAPTEVSIAQTTVGPHGPVSEVGIFQTTLDSNSPFNEVSIPQTTLSSEGASAEISVARTTQDANFTQGLPVMPNDDVEQVNNVQISSMSPKSVLLSTFSVSSFDQYIDQEIGREHSVQDLRSLAIQNSTVPVEHSTTPRSSDDDDVQILQESSSQILRMSSLEAEDIELTIELKISGSHEAHPEPLNPTVGTSSTSFSNASNSSPSIEKEPDDSSKRLLEESKDNSISNGHDPDVKAKGVVDESSSSSGSH